MDKNILNQKLIQINGKIRSYEMKILKEKGVSLTHREFDYLGIMDNTDVPKLSILASFIGVSTGTLSNTMKKMKSKGYISTGKINNDKRSKMVQLTTKGKEAIKIRNEIREKYFDKIKEEIGVSKIKLLINAMDTLIKLL